MSAPASRPPSCTRGPAPARPRPWRLHTRPVRTVLVWSHAHRDNNVYARDRVVYALLRAAGLQLHFFRPHISLLGDLEARFLQLPAVDALWVPSFRRRDVGAAARWAHARGLPLVFDPLISAYDKQVFERHKFAPDSPAAQRLHDREQRVLARADVVVADTAGHARFFAEELGVAPERLIVLPVGADEHVFRPQPLQEHAGPLKVLFFGSFIGLHGTHTLADALAQWQGPPLAMRFIGHGPERAAAQIRLAQPPPTLSVRWDDWLPLDALATAIADTDIVLGIFGTTAKAQRVVPNKVYQALAVGRPVITADTAAFDACLRLPGPAAPIAFTPPGDAAALVATLRDWATARTRLPARAKAAYALFAEHFSFARLGARLHSDLTRLDWGRRVAHL